MLTVYYVCEIANDGKVEWGDGDPYLDPEKAQREAQVDFKNRAIVKVEYEYSDTVAVFDGDFQPSSLPLR